MRTEFLTLDGSASDNDKIVHAAQLLRAGELVAFPTETVYGLGVDARNPEALARLTKVKGRPQGKPFSLLVPSLRQAEEAAGGFSRIARKLARVYWPGPLTLVVPRPGGGRVGLRLPEHAVARSLLAHCGMPLATPSANRSGSAEPISAQQVRDSLDGEIALILDSGPARQGRPSAVVVVEENSIQIDRPGVIPDSELKEVASPTILFVCTGNTCRSPMAAGFCKLVLADTQGKKPAPLPFRVVSAGTQAQDGKGADPMAIEAMREIDIDISGHRTTNLTPSLLDGADWIFTMTDAQRESILNLMPSCADRVQLLSCGKDEIEDPVSHSSKLYRRVRDKIAIHLREVVKMVGGAA